MKQIEANRRNSRLSTGPKTTTGKQRSRGNAVRHGLTAETVISALEDAEDYSAFEAAVTADYDAQSAVERELVLRLASLLWRLRRATTIETGLFDIQANHLREYEQARRISSDHARIVHGIFGGRGSEPAVDKARPELATEASDPFSPNTGCDELAKCFLRLSNLPNYALDRLSRYEATLWRQAAQTVFTLRSLQRRHPHHTRSAFRFTRLMHDEDREAG